MFDCRAPTFQECDLEEILPISVIREYLKVDDIPTVTDDLLRRHRRSGFEAAALYTKRLWHGWQVIQVQLEQPSMFHDRRMRARNTRKVNLPYPATDGMITITGLTMAGGDQTRVMEVPCGATRITVPVYQRTMDCCTPCGPQDNSGAIASYATGVKCPEEVPEGIKLGVLKFMAFVTFNAGDEILTVRGRESNDAIGLVGSNNAALSSGAIEQWRMYVHRA